MTWVEYSVRPMLQELPKLENGKIKQFQNGWKPENPPRRQLCSAGATRLGQMEPDALTTMGVKANCLVMSLLCLLVVIKHKEPRTRQPSRFDEFYSRMRDDEFRATFRVPRPLFNVFVEDMRADLTYKYVCPAHEPRVTRVANTCAVYALPPDHRVARRLTIETSLPNRFLNFISFWPRNLACSGPKKVPHKERVSAENKIASFLYRLATGCTYKMCGEQFGMSTSYAGRCNDEVADLFCKRYGCAPMTC